MKLTKRLALLVLGRIVLVIEQEVTPLDNIMRLVLLFLVLQVTKWALTACAVGATSPAYTVLRFAFLLPTVSLGSFLIPYFFFDFHSSLTISLRPASSLHVSKSGSFTLQKSVRCGKFGSLSARCLADFVVVSSTSLVCASLFCVWSRCCCGSCSCHM